MNQNRRKQIYRIIAAAALAAVLAGCGRSETAGRQNGSAATQTSVSGSAAAGNGANGGAQTESTVSGNIVTAGTGAAEKSQATAGAARLEVRFGDSGEPFVLQMEDNATAAAIAGYVGTSDWRLPIYHYDDYENWEVMQYYDIPSRYEIPSGAVSVTSEKAGEVYYSEPNRIILFYGDADISGEYTKIGSIQDSEEFRSAVENNPVLEGWSNKIVRINSMD